MLVKDSDIGLLDWRVLHNLYCNCCIYSADENDFSTQTKLLQNISHLSLPTWLLTMKKPTLGSTRFFKQNPRFIFHTATNVIFSQLHYKSVTHTRWGPPTFAFHLSQRQFKPNGLNPNFFNFERRPCPNLIVPLIPTDYF